MLPSKINYLFMGLNLLFFVLVSLQMIRRKSLGNLLLAALFSLGAALLAMEEIYLRIPLLDALLVIATGVLMGLLIFAQSLKKP